ncbi:dihydroxyacetone kinase family protein [Mobilicoccus caccae]|uniref:Dihydroxyacetone kinase family protein n=1 Tax=Mobilicoccus caccae TaxID=1859295 RepID=A0ABQ6IV36_9MICO|nr:dihydroxyacetone kinase family protein [Mobilicoccus caccae]GMA41501.1 dihydroxyacetone kinase family protein [Mobilicoccus caccae]
MSDRPALLNDRSDFLPEAIGGLVAAHPDAAWHADPGFVGRADAPRDAETPRVGLVSGGGSGHEPLHIGFIGAGMLTAACPGLLFTSPNALQVVGATRWADAGRGVLHIVKNYTGDVMNFQVARDAVAVDGVETDVVVVADDVATESDEGPGRRGTAATIVVEKVCGAAAERGDDLARVTELGRAAAEASRSMAVAVAPGRLPTADRPTFDLENGSFELGAGIHGEPGVGRIDATSAGELVDTLLTRIAASLELSAGDRIVLVVNGLGATHGLELALVYGEALRRLSEREVVVERGLVGSFVTAVDTAGFSITLTRVDDEMLDLLDAPTAAPAWPNAIAHRPTYEDARPEVDDSLPDGEECGWLSAFVERVQGGIDALTDLDRRAGDADFGTNMEAALGDIDLPVRGDDAGVLQALADRLLVRSGGTSGAVFGTLFRELATARRAEENAAIALATGLERAASAITDLGGAQVGDRTMIDALVPAAQEARACADAGEDDLAACLERVHVAAREGARSTREMTAAKGRASYNADSARGVVDPGAIVVSWLFGGDGDVSAFEA